MVRDDVKECLRASCEASEDPQSLAMTKTIDPNDENASIRRSISLKSPTAVWPTTRGSFSPQECCPTLKCHCGIDWETELKVVVEERSSTDMIISHLPCNTETCICELIARSDLSPEVDVRETQIFDNLGGCHWDEPKSSTSDRSPRNLSSWSKTDKSNLSLMCPYGLECSYIKDEDFMEVLHFSNEKLNVVYRVQSDHQDVAQTVETPHTETEQRSGQRSKSSRSSCTPTTVRFPDECACDVEEDANDECACDEEPENDSDTCACDDTESSSKSIEDQFGNFQFVAWKTRPLEMKEHLFCPPDMCTCITLTTDLEAFMAEPIGVPFLPTFKRSLDDSGICPYDDVPCQCSTFERDSSTGKSSTVKSVRIEGYDLNEPPPPSEPLTQDEFPCDCEKYAGSQMTVKKISLQGLNENKDGKRVEPATSFPCEHHQPEKDEAFENYKEPVAKSYGKSNEHDSLTTKTRDDTPAPWSVAAESGFSRGGNQRQPRASNEPPLVSGQNVVTSANGDSPCLCTDCKKKPQTGREKFSNASESTYGDGKTVQSLSKGTPVPGRTPWNTPESSIGPRSQNGSVRSGCTGGPDCDSDNCRSEKCDARQRISEVSASIHGDQEKPGTQSYSLRDSPDGITPERGRTPPDTLESSIRTSSATHQSIKIPKCPRDFPCNCVDCKKKPQKKRKKVSNTSESTYDDSGTVESFSKGTPLPGRTPWNTPEPSIGTSFKSAGSKCPGGPECDCIDCRVGTGVARQRMSKVSDSTYGDQEKSGTQSYSTRDSLDRNTLDRGRTPPNTLESSRRSSSATQQSNKIQKCPRDFPCNCVDCKKKPQMRRKKVSNASESTYGDENTVESISKGTPVPGRTPWNTPELSMGTASIKVSERSECPGGPECDCIDCRAGTGEGCQRMSKVSDSTYGDQEKSGTQSYSTRDSLDRNTLDRGKTPPNTLESSRRSSSDTQQSNKIQKCPRDFPCNCVDCKKKPQMRREKVSNASESTYGDEKTVESISKGTPVPGRTPWNTPELSMGTASIKVSERSECPGGPECDCIDCRAGTGEGCQRMSIVSDSTYGDQKKYGTQSYSTRDSLDRITLDRGRTPPNSLESSTRTSFGTQQSTKIPKCPRDFPCNCVDCKKKPQKKSTKVSKTSESTYGDSRIVESFSKGTPVPSKTPWNTPETSTGSSSKSAKSKCLGGPECYCVDCTSGIGDGCQRMSEVSKSPNGDQEKSGTQSYSTRDSLDRNTLDRGKTPPNTLESSTRTSSATQQSSKIPKCPRDFPCNSVDCKKKLQSRQKKFNNASESTYGDGKTVESTSKGTPVPGRTPWNTPEPSTGTSSSKKESSPSDCPGGPECDCVNCRSGTGGRCQRMSKTSESTYVGKEMSGTQSYSSHDSPDRNTLDRGRTPPNTLESSRRTSSATQQSSKIPKCPRDFPCNCVDCKKKPQTRRKKVSDASETTYGDSGTVESFSKGTPLPGRTPCNTPELSMGTAAKIENVRSQCPGGPECNCVNCRIDTSEEKSGTRSDFTYDSPDRTTLDRGRTPPNTLESSWKTSSGSTRSVKILKCPRDFPCNCVDCKKKPQSRRNKISNASGSSYGHGRTVESFSKETPVPIRTPWNTPEPSIGSSSKRSKCPGGPECDCVDCTSGTGNDCLRMIEVSKSTNGDKEKSGTQSYSTRDSSDRITPDGGRTPPNTLQSSRGTSSATQKCGKIPKCPRDLPCNCVDCKKKPQSRQNKISNMSESSYCDFRTVESISKGTSVPGKTPWNTPEPSIGTSSKNKSARSACPGGPECDCVDCTSGTGDRCQRLSEVSKSTNGDQEKSGTQTYSTRDSSDRITPDGVRTSPNTLESSRRTSTQKRSETPKCPRDISCNCVDCKMKPQSSEGKIVNASQSTNGESQTIESHSKGTPVSARTPWNTPELSMGTASKIENVRSVCPGGPECNCVNCRIDTSEKNSGTRSNFTYDSPDRTTLNRGRTPPNTLESSWKTSSASTRSVKILKCPRDFPCNCVDCKKKPQSRRNKISNASGSSYGDGRTVESFSKRTLVPSQTPWNTPEPSIGTSSKNESARSACPGGPECDCVGCTSVTGDGCLRMTGVSKSTNGDKEKSGTQSYSTRDFSDRITPDGGRTPPNTLQSSRRTSTQKRCETPKCPRDFPCNCVDCKMKPQSRGGKIVNAPQSTFGDSQTIDSHSKGTPVPDRTPWNTRELSTSTASKKESVRSVCPGGPECNCVNCTIGTSEEKSGTQSNFTNDSPDRTTLNRGRTPPNTLESSSKTPSVSQQSSKIRKCPRDFPCNCVDCKKKARSRRKKISDTSGSTYGDGRTVESFSKGTSVPGRTPWNTPEPSIGTSFKNESARSECPSGPDCDCVDCRSGTLEKCRRMSQVNKSIYGVQENLGTKSYSTRDSLYRITPDQGKTPLSTFESSRGTFSAEVGNASQSTFGDGQTVESLFGGISEPARTPLNTPVLSMAAGSVLSVCVHGPACNCIDCGENSAKNCPRIGDTPMSLFGVQGDKRRCSFDEVNNSVWEPRCTDSKGTQKSNNVREPDSNLRNSSVPSMEALTVGSGAVVSLLSKETMEPGATTSNVPELSRGTPFVTCQKKPNGWSPSTLSDTAKSVRGDRGPVVSASSQIDDGLTSGNETEKPGKVPCDSTDFSIEMLSVQSSPRKSFLSKGTVDPGVTPRSSVESSRGVPFESMNQPKCPCDSQCNNVDCRKKANVQSSVKDESKSVHDYQVTIHSLQGTSEPDQKLWNTSEPFKETPFTQPEAPVSMSSKGTVKPGVTPLNTPERSRCMPTVSTSKPKCPRDFPCDSVYCSKKYEARSQITAKDTSGSPHKDQETIASSWSTPEPCQTPWNTPEPSRGTSSAPTTVSQLLSSKGSVDLGETPRNTPDDSRGTPSIGMSVPGSLSSKRTVDPGVTPQNTLESSRGTPSVSARVLKCPRDLPCDCIDCKKLKKCKSRGVTERNPRMISDSCNSTRSDSGKTDKSLYPGATPWNTPEPRLAKETPSSERLRRVPCDSSSCRNKLKSKSARINDATCKDTRDSEDTSRGSPSKPWSTLSEPLMSYETESLSVRGAAPTLTAEDSISEGTLLPFRESPDWGTPGPRPLLRPKSCGAQSSQVEGTRTLSSLSTSDGGHRVCTDATCPVKKGEKVPCTDDSCKGKEIPIESFRETSEAAKSFSKSKSSRFFEEIYYDYKETAGSSRSFDPGATPWNTPEPAKGLESNNKSSRDCPCVLKSSDRESCGDESTKNYSMRTRITCGSHSIGDAGRVLDTAKKVTCYDKTCTGKNIPRREKTTSK